MRILSGVKGDMDIRAVITLLLLLSSVYSLSQADVIIVRSDMPYEFAVAQGYSHISGVPIISTPPQELGSTEERMLSGYLEMGYRRAVILGGERAISRDIQKKLDEMGFITRRIAEADRYGTAATFAKEFYQKSRGAVLVYGGNETMLLYAERISAKLGYPLLFVKKDSVPLSVLEALKELGAKEVYIVGDANIEHDLKGFKIFRVEGEPKPKNHSQAIYLLLSFGIGFGTALALHKIRERKEKIPAELLTEDEEKIVKIMQEHGGKITQDRLPELTGFSRPKITRLVYELESRGIIEKKSKGRTNELVLIKNVEM